MHVQSDFFLHRNAVVYLLVCNVIRCEYKHLSSGPVSSGVKGLKRQSKARTDASSQLLASCSFFAKPNSPHNPALETWETPPQSAICLRLARVNRINPCPSRFKTEPARQRIILRLLSSSRQLGRNTLTTLPPSRLLGKIKRPLHVWIFIKANETLCKLAEWSHLGSLLRDDNNHRHPYKQMKG